MKNADSIGGTGISYRVCSCGLGIDGVAQFEALLDGAGAEVEEFVNLAGNLAVGHVHAASSQALPRQISLMTSENG